MQRYRNALKKAAKINRLMKKGYIVHAIQVNEEFGVNSLEGDYA